MMKRIFPVFAMAAALSFAQQAQADPPMPILAQDNGVSHSMKHASIESGHHARLPEIPLDLDTELSWHELLDGYVHVFWDVPAPVVTYDAHDWDFANALGFEANAEGRPVASDHALLDVLALSRDTALTELLRLYAEYQRTANASRATMLAESLRAMFEEYELTYEQKIGIYLTMQPWLIRHAIDSQSQIQVRKLRETEQSMQRLWPDMQLAIECTHGDASYRFTVASLTPGTEMNGGLMHAAEVPADLPLKLPASGTEMAAAEAPEAASGTEMAAAGAPEAASGTEMAAAHAPKAAPILEANPVESVENPPREPETACRVIPMRLPPMHPNQRMEQALHETIWALVSKDTDYAYESMERLITAIDAVDAHYGYIAGWNDHWDNAPVDAWICKLHTIELLLHEKDRFMELLALDRRMSKLFHTTFYQRLARNDECHDHLMGAFLSEQRRLEADHDDAYRWIVQNFSPKNAKKLDKAFATWTHRGKDDIRHRKRLLAFWTAWSNGDHAKAVQYAGDVVEKRGRIAHPQLHSLGMFLRAVRGEDVKTEDLQTYIRVLRLKHPGIPYQTLREAYPFLTVAQRKAISNVMRDYDPSHAPHAAAEFFRTWQKEMRTGMSPAHLSAIDAWLETELRQGETAAEANRRRLQWFTDLHASKDWRGIERLATLVAEDSGAWGNFWHSLRDCAQKLAAGTHADIPAPDLPQACSWKVDSPESWMASANACARKILSK